MADLADLAISLGSTAAGGYLTSKAYSKQQEQLSRLNNAMAAYRSMQGEKTRDTSDQYINTLQPQARADRQQVIDADYKTSYDQSLAGVRGNEVPETTTGTGSNYARVRQAGQQRTDERLARAFQQMQALGGQQIANQQDAIRYGRAAYDVGSANSAAKNVSDAYMRSMQLTQPDPYLRIAGEIMRGVGLAYGIPRGSATTTPRPDGRIFEDDVSFPMGRY